MRYILGFIGLFVAACEQPVVVVSYGDTCGETAQCWDYNPCSFDFYSEKYGCTHEQAPNGASCFDDVGIGVCAYGLCTHPDECEDGTVDMLQGTCKIGRCIGGRMGLVSKISGVPCVLPRPIGDPPWIEGTCDNAGTCISSIP
jgi:hypothetical protein